MGSVEDDLRYPIGMYEPVRELNEEDRRQLIREVEIQPASLRAMVEKLTSEQLETPYRSGGWTIRQVVHHLADNNMNAYIRFKRGLTEDAPSSPSYREDLRAELPDYRQASPCLCWKSYIGVLRFYCGNLSRKISIVPSPIQHSA